MTSGEGSSIRSTSFTGGRPRRFLIVVGSDWHIAFLERQEGGGIAASSLALGTPLLGSRN
jgi:hypothetical protein